MEIKVSDNSKYDFLKIWEVLRKFLSESIIFSLLQFSLPLSNGSGTISWNLLGILFFVSLSTLLICKGHKERFIITFYCCTIPIMIFSKIVLDISFIEIIFLFLFSMWRLHVFMNEGYDDEYEEFMEHRLIATLLIFVFMYFIGYLIQMPIRYMMTFFLLFQMFLFSYGTLIKRFLQSKNELINKKAFFIFGTYLLLIPIAVAAIFNFIGRWIKQGLSIILYKVFWFIAYLISPVINYLIDYFDIHIARLDKIIKQQEKKKQVIPENHDNGDAFSAIHHGHAFIFVGIIVLIIGVFLYWQYRKWTIEKDTEIKNFNHDKFTFFKQMDKQKKESIRSNHYSKSNQQIREYVFDLERFAAKMKTGRHASESVRDWLVRLKIGASDHWISLYENVRYGSIHVSNQELKQFSDEVKEIKKIIKDIHKN